MNVSARAHELIAQKPWSKIGLKRTLRSEECPEEEIRKAIGSLEREGVRWPRECLRGAREICQRENAVSRQNLRRQLSEEGFVPAEVEYAEKTIAVNWFDHARRAYEQAVRPGVDQMMPADMLSAAGFTPREIAYALREEPAAAEEQALAFAEYLLASAPSSEQAVRRELSSRYEKWVVASVIEELGDIWDEQALSAAWRLLGRYGPALSQQRLGNYLRVQDFTLQQIARVYQDFPIDWDEQAVDCARYYHYCKGIAFVRLKDSVRHHKFTTSQARAAVRQLREEVQS